jgi:hypothetical protein
MYDELVTQLQYKEAKKSQIMHVQAVKTLRDYYDRGAWQVKGSPLLYPASRRPIPKLEYKNDLYLSPLSQ